LDDNDIFHQSKTNVNGSYEFYMHPLKGVKPADWNNIPICL